MPRQYDLVWIRIRRKVARRRRWLGRRWRWRRRGRRWRGSASSVGEGGTARLVADRPECADLIAVLRSSAKAHVGIGGDVRARTRQQCERANRSGRRAEDFKSGLV